MIHTVSPAEENVAGRAPLATTAAYPSGRWQNHPVDLSLPVEHYMDARRIVEAAVAILEQGEVLLQSLSDADYTRRVPQAFNGCIGGHYRHCLDHFTSLLRGLDADVVDYDHRDRNVRLESEPVFALALTRETKSRLEALPDGVLDVRVAARCEVNYSHGSSPLTTSSIGRELVYCIAHAIHHYALISIIGRSLDVQLPEHFGVAPSTVTHQRSGSSRQPAHD